MCGFFYEVSSYPSSSSLVFFPIQSHSTWRAIGKHDDGGKFNDEKYISTVEYRLYDGQNEEQGETGWCTRQKEIF